MPTDPLHDLPSPRRASVVAHLDRLRHDLGKAISMQVRWGGDGRPQALAEALRADLLGTRRGPDGDVGALELWAALRGPLEGEDALVDLRGDPDFEQIRGSMAEIADVVEALARERVPPEVVEAGVRAAVSVTTACRALWRRIQGV